VRVIILNFCTLYIKRGASPYIKRKSLVIDNFKYINKFKVDMNKKAQLGFGLGPAKRKRMLSPADKKRIAANQGWKCANCGRPLSARFHVDHIKPFSEGGSDSDSNLQALCPNCHSDKTEEERYRKKQKKIREAGHKEKDILGLGGMFKAPSRRKEPSLFGGRDIFGVPKRRKSTKEPNIFGGGDMFGPAPKKGRKKKGPFDL